MDRKSNNYERKPPKPLTIASLDWFALRYVERFATTRVKLRRYLQGKLRERGWAGDGDAPIDAVVDRLAGRGYVDDRAFGEAKARGLERRGFGVRRVTQALTAAGLEADLRTEIGETVDGEAAAIAYARRKKLGPFAVSEAGPELQRKQFAAMVRAGHPFDVVKRVLTARSKADRSGFED